MDGQSLVYRCSNYRDINVNQKKKKKTCSSDRTGGNKWARGGHECGRREYLRCREGDRPFTGGVSDKPVYIRAIASGVAVTMVFVRDIP